MQFRFKKLFLCAFSLLLTLNLQGMENGSESIREFSENVTVQEDEPEELSLKSIIKAIITYGPTIYTYGWPIRRFIANLPCTSTDYKFLFIKGRESASKKRDFSPEFLECATIVMNKMGIKPSALTFCHSNDYLFNRSDITAAMDGNRIFIYSKDFLKWSFDAQIFTFAHECIHLKEKHTLLLTSAGILMPFITHYGIKGYQWMADNVIDYCTKKYNLQNNKTVQNCIYVHNTIVNSGLFHAIITGLAHHNLARYSEMRADIGAAKVLNSVKGGIELFSKEVEFEHSVLQRFKGFKNLLVKCIIFCVKAYDYHPSFQTRIAYLTKLQDQFEK